jgi:HSP20 family protein
MNLVPGRGFFDFDDMMDLWGPLRSGWKDTGTLMPRVDIKDKNDSYEVTAELPGVKKEDIHVSLRNGMLTIEAETRQEDKEEKDGKIIRQERRYGKFLRSFDVGGDVNDGDIQASFKDGVLTVTTPKGHAKAPAARRIEVK